MVWTFSLKTDDCKNANIARHTQRPMFFHQKEKNFFEFSFFHNSLHSISLLGLSLPIFSHKLNRMNRESDEQSDVERNDLLKFNSHWEFCVAQTAFDCVGCQTGENACICENVLEHFTSVPVDSLMILMFI